jgi:hypothetical protein
VSFTATSRMRRPRTHGVLPRVPGSMVTRSRESMHEDYRGAKTAPRHAAALDGVCRRFAR